ncbi:MAG: UDP-N-acetylmuramoyl-tripeptide--D-alanyl-D-alanine ligase [Desulfovibrio sp.]|jgi:UDP-N-acetylmuramoyl-tripeptide--D-alanyl-D-alanine ligase|nr:UDP-N-acetylmuramoyl-tripeptide--D-alanyl-D-alanine ligase [Desulfovibrio sp.]
MRLKYHEAAAWLGLAPRCGDRLLTSVATDSREVKPGALFVCIRGEHADGHDFVRQAEEAGAAAVLASRALPRTKAPVLRVRDTIRALGRLAAYWRRSARAKVTGVTGTAGKTTLKELLAQLLAVRGKTARNALNFNNQIGMPRAVLTTDGDEDFWVMEAGISREGDMEELGEILRPDMGLILNAGMGHTERLGAGGVAAHKAALLRCLAPGGCGLISADYPDLVREAAATGATLHFFSAGDASVKYYAVYEGPAPRHDGPDGVSGRYRLCLDGEWTSVVAPFRGEFGAENCIAAAAAAHLMGLSGDEIAAGFRRAAMPARRFSRKHFGGWDVIDDTYNANPLSMRRMLDAASELAEGRAFVPVLGEMLELGDAAASEHEKLGLHLAKLAPAGVLWKGGHAPDILSGLKKSGYAGPFAVIGERGNFIAAVQGLLHDKNPDGRGGVILFKGSRRNRLEEEYAEFCARCRAGRDATGKTPGEDEDVL